MSRYWVKNKLCEILSYFIYTVNATHMTTQFHWKKYCVGPSHYEVCQSTKFLPWFSNHLHYIPVLRTDQDIEKEKGKYMQQNHSVIQCPALHSCDSKNWNFAVWETERKKKAHMVIQWIHWSPYGPFSFSLSLTQHAYMHAWLGTNFISVHHMS